MFSNNAYNLICKSALIVALVVAGPAMEAQDARIVLPGTAAYDALPSAVTPVSAGHTALSTQSYSTIHVPESNSIKPIKERGPEALPSRRQWLALTLLSSGAAEFDAYSTRRSV